MGVVVLEARVVVIGSGAAGLNAAVHAAEAGIDPSTILIVTEEWGGGTSYNSGSDKQTYYRLSISGDAVDSPLLMAQDLYNGGSMHGDVALAEAAGSIEEFFHLVRIGVDFPRNEFGTYPGYQTDNDTRQRGTSVGPYTSRVMVEALACEATRLGIGLLDGHVAARILVDEVAGARRVVGVACLGLGDPNAPDAPVASLRDVPTVIVLAPAVILATGGPANIYASSVYPVQQKCSHGLGIEAGATLQNLAFMQYGIASKSEAFRWNLSGSFQQVIPAYWVEVDSPIGRVELLHGWLPGVGDLAYQTFLKGYHWPFNPARCDLASPNHSSVIDIAVYDAVVRQGKRVFMDFRVNPWDLIGAPFSIADLHPEASRYLQASNAVGTTPIERLKVLNPFAIAVYADHGIHLDSEAIEIHVATQHCNGGFTGDINWESTSVQGLYPVGEANGSHGQHRPGGAALNAGQVGGLRAARHIAASTGDITPSSLANVERVARQQFVPILNSLRVGDIDGSRGGIDADEVIEEVRQRMAHAAGILRSPRSLAEASNAAGRLVSRLDRIGPAGTRRAIRACLAARDAAITHHAILSAMAEQAKCEPGVHPCYIMVDDDDADLVRAIRGLNVDVKGIQGGMKNRILETRIINCQIGQAWVDARAVPDVHERFECLLKRRAGALDRDGGR